MGIYLDYNASAPIDSRVLDVMIDVYRNAIGNSDSRTHDYGNSARNIVENARKQVSSLLGVNSDEVFFTSGATESINISILGLQEYAEKTGKKHIITSSIEHKAVLETVKELSKRGFNIDFINPDISGRVNADEICSKVREDTLLVSLMHVNNETGIIQPVKEVGDYLAERDVLFHIDATQSCGKMVKELQTLKYNMLSFSAHKLQGPQGVGGLILKKQSYRLPPVKNIIYGGQQEHGIRPGTVPVALAAGCGKACEIAQQNYLYNKEKLQNIKSAMIKSLNDSGIEYGFNGDQRYCVDSTMNIYFPNVMSEALMLSTKQWCAVSNGSACTSKNYSPSYVLVAMGIPVEQIECSVRISWGPDISINEATDNFKALLETAKLIRY